MTRSNTVLLDRDLEAEGGSVTDDRVRSARASGDKLRIAEFAGDVCLVLRYVGRNCRAVMFWRLSGLPAQQKGNQRLVPFGGVSHVDAI